jgi:hypothetical protein
MLLHNIIILISMKAIERYVSLSSDDTVIS